MKKRPDYNPWLTPQGQQLVMAIARLKTKAEIRCFLRDLLTESEIKEFGARWQAAQMLDRHIPYTRIVDETGLSSTTVARVQHWLLKGAGGYRLMLKRMRT